MDSGSSQVADESRIIETRTADRIQEHDDDVPDVRAMENLKIKQKDVAMDDADKPT